MIKDSAIFHLDLNCKFLNPNRLKFNIDAITSFASSNDFWTAIKKVQSNEVTLIRKSSEPELIWYDFSHDNLEKVILNLMGIKNNENLPDEIIYNKEEIAILEPKIIAALDLFEEIFPEIYQYFKKINPFIIIARQNGFYGGTVSNRIGFIWLSPVVEWSVVDFAEQLFHEFIHNCLFLEEMVHDVMPHTAKRMEEEDGLVTSAIRQIKRGYDKSYHAAFVSYGLICYYMRLANFEKAEKYVNPLIISLNDLVQNQKFLSLNGIALLDELCANVLAKKNILNDILYCG